MCGDHRAPAWPWGIPAVPGCGELILVPEAPKNEVQGGSEQVGCVSGCCRCGKGLLLCPWLALT